MTKVSNCVWRSTSAIHPIAHNLFCQFWNVTFNQIFCKLILMLFYGIPTGANLTSPNCHDTGCFFAPSRKSVHTYIVHPVKKFLKSPKWHWLILSPIGANGNTQGRPAQSTASGNIAWLVLISSVSQPKIEKLIALRAELAS